MQIDSNTVVRPPDKGTTFKPLEATSKMDKKSSKAAELQRLLEYKLKFNVIEELIELYRSGELKPADQRQMLSDLMRYMYPQLKAMEIDTRDGEKINVNIVFPGGEKPEIKVEENLEN